MHQFHFSVYKRLQALANGSPAALHTQPHATFYSCLQDQHTQSHHTAQTCASIKPLKI
jgi:hypothetical protein